MADETIIDTPITPTAPPEDKKRKDRNTVFRNSVAACKQYRRKLIRDWDINVAYRRGKPFSSQADDDRVVVNLDWSYTKIKQASLFSQIPAIRVSHPPQTLDKSAEPWLHPYEQRINDTLIEAGIETAMEEVLPDCINAAGIGIAVVAYEALTEDTEIPSIDLSVLPEQIQTRIMQTGMLPNGQPVPMETVPKVIDKRYIICRVSPSDFLWPLSFNESDFDNASWIGRSGRVTWETALNRWKLDPNKKQTYLGTEQAPQEVINYDTERNVEGEQEEYVSFDEIFYKSYQYGGGVKLFKAIHHLVFVTGQETPVVDEPWKGQEIDEQGNIIGSLKYPIRVLSLSYITDEAIPPSDSAVGRPQVNEIIKARTQMILQREHSLPMRAINIDRLDPTTVYNLMKGKWQAMIPVQGPGDKVITDVSRSSFPQENFNFDIIANRDLEKIWLTSQPVTGEQVETKGEAMAIQSQVSTRAAHERARVGKFFCGIAEVLGGLICLYEDPNTLGQGFNPIVSKTLSYSILADSTILLDSQQRLKRIQDFVNMYAKSGWVNLEPVLKEAATLSGLDPAITIQAPKPTPAPPPNISLRLSGSEDLMNPLTLAFLMPTGQAPTQQMVEAAKKLIESAVILPPINPLTGLPMPYAPPEDIEGADGGPNGPNGAPPATPPLAPPILPGEIPPPPPPPIGAANPDYTSMDKVNQRTFNEGRGQ